MSLWVEGGGGVALPWDGRQVPVMILSLRTHFSVLSVIEGKRRRGWQRMRWLDSSTDSVDMNLSKLQEIVEDRGAWCAAVPWGGKESDMT